LTLTCLYANLLFVIVEKSFLLSIIIIFFIFSNLTKDFLLSLEAYIKLHNLLPKGVLVYALFN